MKKKLVILLLSTMMAVTAVGCGNNKNEGVNGTETVESTENGTEEEVIAASRAFADLKGSDYTKLCDYNGIEVTITGDYTVKDTAREDYFKSVFENYGPFFREDPEKTTVGEGDIVNVDYVGKLDGVAFNGGTAEGQDIDVYNNSSANGASSYIEGFTEGLKGASVGDVIDCDVTFPENYGNADLAGKAVVFTFTVNSIQREMTIDEMDDKFAQDVFNAESLDALYTQVQEYLEQTAKANKERDTYTAVQDYLLANCTVDVPKDAAAARVADFRRQIVETQCGGDETKLEEFASTYYGKSLEELEAQWDEIMTENLKLELIMDAIVEDMGLTVTEEEFNTYIQNGIAAGQFANEEALFQSYGFGDAAFGESYLRKRCLYETALTKVVEKAVVKEAPAEAAGTETVENTEMVENTEE